MSSELQIIPLEPLVEQIRAFAPYLEKSLKAEEYLKAANAELNSLLEEWDGTPSEDIDQAVEEAMASLTLSKNAYDKWQAMREAITKPLDELKKQLMVPEKRVAYDGKTDNHYTAIKQTLARVENIKLARVKRQEQAAQLQKEKDIAKVDVQTQIKKNLAQMVIDRVVYLEEWSQKFFNDATVENFDEQAEKYQGMKPSLKPELWQKCYESVVASAKLSSDEVKAVKEALMEDESFEKYNEAIIQGSMPILNGWRARIDQLKQEKIALANAKGAEKTRLEEEKRKRDEEALQVQQQQAEEAKQQANTNIQQEAEMSKMESEFTQQAVVQSLEPTGPKKKILRFTDDKVIAKSLATVMYHCLLSPKFGGIYKKDKNKAIVMEDDMPAYVDQVDWWTKFFAANCDAAIPGTELKEVAKIIVKK